MTLTTMRTDIGNAERMLDRHGAELRYVPAWKSWLVWDGRRWARDETLEVHRRAKDSVRSMWAELNTIDDAKERGAWAQHAVQSESDGKIRATISRAAAEPGVAVAPNDLDADPWLLTVMNGTLDLRTGQLAPHSRDTLATKLVPIAFDAEARCDRWEAFLRRVLGDNAEMISFLQRAVGYSLTGNTGERILLFLYGMGANGKSTFLEVLRAVTGEYSAQADFATFLEKKGDGPRNDVARLFGARVVTSSEVGEGKRLNESLVKTLTGNDTVSARFLYAEAFEFRPAFKLWLAANHRPVIRGTDNAIWERVRLVPFTVQIPEAERDKTLLDALKGELSGILSWAVAGCLLWQRDGLGAPAEVRAATAEYRRDSDILGIFLEESCELGDGLATPASELYVAYRRWAQEGGEYEMSQTTFGRRLTDRGLTPETRGTGANRLAWRLGVRLLRTPGVWSSPASPNGKHPLTDRSKAAAHDRDEQEAFIT